MTDVPLGIGAAVEAEFSQVRFGVTALWEPPAYVALADEVGQAVGGYNDVTSALVRAATENAFGLRLRLGYRPLADRGFYVDANYTLITLGGAFTTADLAVASGQSGAAGASAGWDLNSTIHQVGFEIGYRFPMDPVTLRVALGGSFTVDAKVDATAIDPQRPSASTAVEEVGALYLENVYRSFVHVPVLTVAVGWDLFPSG